MIAETSANAALPCELHKVDRENSQIFGKKSFLQIFIRLKSSALPALFFFQTPDLRRQTLDRKAGNTTRNPNSRPEPRELRRVVSFLPLVFSLIIGFDNIFSFFIVPNIHHAAGVAWQANIHACRVASQQPTSIIQHP